MPKANSNIGSQLGGRTMSQLGVRLGRVKGGLVRWARDQLIDRSMESMGKLTSGLSGLAISSNEPLSLGNRETTAN